MVVLQICAFAAPTPGNFIPSLLGLEKALNQKNISTIYAFPERAKDKAWCVEIQERTKVYFLPETHARINIDTYRKIRKIFKENAVGVVHSHFELYDIPAALIAPKGIKVFWHLHDALKANYEKASLSRRLLTRMQYGWFGKRAKLLSVSKEHAEFAAKLGFAAGNIEYVPNGINTDRINIELIDSSLQRNYLLIFGWEVYRKGVDLLVEAVRGGYNSAHIKVVGQDECEAYLRRENISHAIVFSRPVLDINELYMQTSVFLHISRAEGLSYALLEAIYAGLPVICSNIPENEFAREFRNIYWIRNGNIEDLREILDSVQMIQQKVTIDDILFNRRLIDERYSLNTWISRLVKYYV